MSKNSALQVFNEEGNKLTGLFGLKESTEWIVMSDTECKYNFGVDGWSNRGQRFSSEYSLSSIQHLYLILPDSSGFTHQLPSVSLFSPLLSAQILPYFTPRRAGGAPILSVWWDTVRSHKLLYFSTLAHANNVRFSITSSASRQTGFWRNGTWPAVTESARTSD